MQRTKSFLALIFCLGVLACSGTAPEAEETASSEGAQTAPPAAPAPKILVVAAGSRLEVRLSDRLSSNVNKSGDRFKATLEQDLKAGEELVAPAGSSVTGKLVEVKDSGKVKGKARISLALTSIQVGESDYSVDTEQITVEAEGTKGRDAKVIGGGAGVGALIGGLTGGKKGAAIGAAIGGGAGTAAVLVTEGEHVEFAPEQKFSFVLAKDLQVSK